MLELAPSSHHDRPRPDATGELILAEVLWFGRSQGPLVLLVTLVALLVGALVTLTRTPLYTAYAQLLIDPRPAFLLREQAAEGAIVLDTPQMESQIAVIRSERLLMRVAEKLEKELAQHAAAAPAGSWIRLWDAWHADRAEKAPTRAGLLRARAGEIQIALDVHRIGVSHVLELSYRASSPDLAAIVVNAVGEAYVRDQFDVRTEAARKGGEWLEERIDELRRQMNAAAFAVQEFKARRDYRIAGRGGDAAAPASTGPKGELKDERGEATSLEELETRAYSYRKIYESYLQAYAEALQRQSYPVSGGRLIAEAVPPKRKSHPRTLVSLAIAGAMGLLAGLGIGLLRFSLDTSIRSAGHFRRVFALECLGETERGPGAQNAGRWLDRAVQAPGALLSLLFGGRSPTRPSLHGAVVAHAAIRALRSVGVVSCARGEGRTRLAQELAVLSCQSGLATLLIDADLRNRSLTASWKAEGRAGFIDALAGHCSAMDAVMPAVPGAPACLPAGSRVAAPSLDAAAPPARAIELLNALAASFDRIIIDLPPVGDGPDWINFAAQLDGSLLVIEALRTPRAQVEVALRTMAACDVKVAGVVIDKCISPPLPWLNETASAKNSS